MESFDFFLPENFYAINVGIINFIELENLRQEAPEYHYRMEKLLEEYTVSILFNHHKHKSLRQLIEEKQSEHIEHYELSLQPQWRDSLHEFLSRLGYWTVVKEGFVFKKYPIDVVLTLKEDEYGFYTALRLRQLRFHEIDGFLDYQLRESFGGEKTTCHRFLQLLLREYKTEFFNEDIFRTVEEWIILNQTEKTVQKKTQKNTSIEKNKIICKADAETIQRYFYKLARQNVLPKESIDHFLSYAFAVFEKEVPAIKFTPENIKKGELMKFIHHFYTLHSYSRLEAGLWIKLLLLDSFTTFDSKDKSETEIIEYIKDNWSKEPVQYLFRKV